MCCEAADDNCNKPFSCYNLNLSSQIVINFDDEGGDDDDATNDSAR